MELRKIELGLEGDEYWPRLPIVHVEGDPSAKPIPPDATQSEREEIIRSWDMAAVLKVSPNDGRALVGFWAGNMACQYLNVPVEPTEEGLFAMRVSGGDVDFFIIPEDHETNYQLELVEVTSIDNPTYANVPLY